MRDVAKLRLYDEGTAMETKIDFPLPSLAFTLG